MADKSLDVFSSASSPSLNADQIWEKVQKTLGSPETRHAARILPAAHFMFGPRIEDMVPQDFAEPVATEPLVLAFFRTDNKVFLLTRTMESDDDGYEISFGGDEDNAVPQAAALSLQELTGAPVGMPGMDDIQYPVFVCQRMGDAQILTDLPAHKALEIMEYAQENDLLIQPFSEEDARQHLRTIAALRAEVYGPAAPGASADLQQNNPG